MTDSIEMERKFWKALRDDKTLMLGVTGAGPAQPMTAQFDEDTGHNVYVFTAKDTDLVRALDSHQDAFAYFVAKDHGLFAAIDGRLTLDNDPQMIERLWNPFVEAWFEGGKSDPKLALIRFEPGRAQIWLNDHSFLAGVKLLLGRDPKQEYKDKTAEVRL
ncbi:MAG: pyridoxamine 5'-phosphate oxidase family protein [Alphaproteobacteria bacterium]|nr:pyridoxamine 5'-phosphate oxidase family protein [Alphaproteobacteria bacterium]